MPPFFPKVTNSCSSCSSPLLTFLRFFANSLFLHDSCFYLVGEERGDLDLSSYQSISPLSEGKPLDLDLGGIWCSSLFFLSSPPNSISCFGGIWEWRILSTSCVLAHCIGLSSPRWYVEIEVEKLVTLGYLGWPRACPLGYLECPRRSLLISEFWWLAG